MIEFKLTTLTGFILIPFALFNKTAFLAEKVLGNIVASGVKVMVLAVIVGIGTGLFSQFTQTYTGGQPTVQALSVVLAALAMLGLGIFGPGIATGLVSGAPQLGAGAAVGTGLSRRGYGDGRRRRARPGRQGSDGGRLRHGRRGARRCGDGRRRILRLQPRLGRPVRRIGRRGWPWRCRTRSGFRPRRARCVARPASASSSMRRSFAAGARSSFAATGGSSTQGTVGGGNSPSASAPAGGGSANSGPPPWAQRIKRNQSMVHGAQTAAQVLKSGDSHGGGHSVDLSGE